MSECKHDSIGMATDGTTFCRKCMTINVAPTYAELQSRLDELVKAAGHAADHVEGAASGYLECVPVARDILRAAIARAKGER